jgi:DNA-binding CsgD family transcriptional regulator
VRSVDYRLSGRPKIHIAPDWLRDAYVVRGRSCADIAREIGANANTVHRRLYAYGIPVRRPWATRARSDRLPEDVLTKKHLSAALGERKLSRGQIAEQTGFSLGTVNNYVRRHGLATPRRIPDIDPQRLATLQERGLSVAAMAAELGCGARAVRRRLTTYGLSSVQPRPRVKIDPAELAHLAAAGWTHGQMAEQFGSAESAIGRRLEHYGLRTVRSRRTAL